MAYGLNSKGIIEDGEWFWSEVKLRAKNNYGDWNFKPYLAESRVFQAIEDIFNDSQASHDKLAHLIYTSKGRINGIVADMITE